MIPSSSSSSATFRRCLRAEYTWHSAVENAVGACEMLSGRSNRSSCTLTRHSVCSARFQFRCELPKSTVTASRQISWRVTIKQQAGIQHSANTLAVCRIASQYRQCRVSASDLSAAGIAATTTYQLWFEPGHRLALCHLQSADIGGPGQHVTLPRPACDPCASHSCS